MKFPFPLAAPRRADRTLLPAVLAALLLMLFFAQWLIPADQPLPAALPIATQGQQFKVPVARPSADQRLLLIRPVFAPRAAMAMGASGPAPVLGGMVIAGTIAVRGHMMAIVRAPDGTVRRVARGESIDGWQLLSLGDASARLGKGSERLDIAYGAAATTPGTEGSEGDEEE